MKCPHCESEDIRKNGHRRDKQNYRCKQCDRQFVAFYSQRGYSEDTKQICLRMHRLGIGFREIERLTGISRNTLIQWIRQAEELSEDAENKERLNLVNSAKLIAPTSAAIEANTKAFPFHGNIIPPIGYVAIPNEL